MEGMLVSLRTVPNLEHLEEACSLAPSVQDISVEVLGGEPLEVKASLPAPATAVVAAACSPCGQHLWCITLDRSLLCISLQDGVSASLATL